MTAQVSPIATYRPGLPRGSAGIRPAFLDRHEQREHRLLASACGIPAIPARAEAA